MKDLRNLRAHRRAGELFVKWCTTRRFPGILSPTVHAYRQGVDASIKCNMCMLKNLSRVNGNDGLKSHVYRHTYVYGYILAFGSQELGDERRRSRRKTFRCKEPGETISVTQVRVLSGVGKKKKKIKSQSYHRLLSKISKLRGILKLDENCIERIFVKRKRSEG